MALAVWSRCAVCSEVSGTISTVGTLGACDKLPAAPDAKAFEAMSWEARCEATMPRAKRCTDELLIAELATLDGGDASELTDALREDLSKKPTYS